jgi:hypothetical protein
MADKTLEQVLANWLSQAIGSEDRLPQGTTIADWVARRTAEWFSAAASDPLAEADAAADRLGAALERLGGWSNPELVGAMDELTHVSDALADLRRNLGLQAERHGDAAP